MNKFLKVLGTAALIAGFAPYKVENDKETGAWSVKALLWQASRKPTDDPGKDDVSFNFGLSSLLREEEEAHLFTDELTVNYSSQDSEPVEPETPPETPEVPEAPEAPEAPAAPEAPEAPAAPEAPEVPETTETSGEA